ncbi:aldehyde dehydrogenase family protein [Synechococcus sp. A10-1-5-1]|uniref:aldehyde dehydrogenase family protein n=1 Tax=Synechococcus sp. A10-1-5-1 TaxID=2936507 RepID=UPI002000D234|nr:aldehyde dehydrogenase family protein [Synechococcus sp. A10-1-5-1]UPM51531.1 aldehyde dehydrogenase family protein [Synechococcus sp. A10-1-5-1]
MRQLVSDGTTRPLPWRLEQLDRLDAALSANSDAVLAALASDLGKPDVEAYFEVVAVRQEINLCRRQLRRWIAPKKVSVPVSQRPGQAEVIAEPLGCVLIIGPWNYPFHLALQPLVSALAAGNTAILKPSEHAPATAQLISALIEQAFPPEIVQVVQGDGSTAQALLAERFDHIFFTGGERIGKIVMGAAAQHLTPVTLELGGKSPAVVLSDADLEVTSRRLVWGKCLNAGQTCIAPDYLLVESGIREALIQALGERITACFGEEPLHSSDLASIVNAAQYQRLSGLLERAREQGQILLGGTCDPERKRIAPTVVAVRDREDPLMQEELFGPLLPVLEVDGLGQAIQWINQRPKPLALYLFSRSKQHQETVLRHTSSGGVCFNDVVMQVGVPELPFGGVGASGMGAYHGKAGFDAFSHRRSVLRRPFALDLPFRYPPYAGRLPLIRRLLG